MFTQEKNGGQKQINFIRAVADLSNICKEQEHNQSQISEQGFGETAKTKTQVEMETVCNFDMDRE